MSNLDVLVMVNPKRLALYYCINNSFQMDFIVSLRLGLQSLECFRVKVKLSYLQEFSRLLGDLLFHFVSLSN